jgi:hypothetical protein
MELNILEMINTKKLIRKIMGKNIITEELIEKRLKAKGFHEEIREDEEKMKELVLDHYEVELTDQWEDGLEYYIYSESTQDGYEVFIATHNPNKICISDDVHYYDHDIAESLCEGIRYSNGYGKIYVDNLEEDFVIEAMETLYESIYDNQTAQVIDNLIDEGYAEQD